MHYFLCPISPAIICGFLDYPKYLSYVHSVAFYPTLNIDNIVYFLFRNYKNLLCHFCQFCQFQSFWGSFWSSLGLTIPQTDKTVNTDMLFFAWDSWDSWDTFISNCLNYLNCLMSFFACPFWHFWPFQLDLVNLVNFAMSVFLLGDIVVFGDIANIAIIASAFFHSFLDPLVLFLATKTFKERSKR